ncbi:hypothetical protein CDAR_99331 [Caerostris darwini]|uniref:Uncharacterized protein n=1 Tax=Caerostris darwini TaxID=1538125 RepID=A0AAV4Q7C1_9ARAC|nr:hypothetical protein CDAR_99331 [Caerostris darwini]
MITDLPLPRLVPKALGPVPKKMTPEKTHECRYTISVVFAGNGNQESYLAHNGNHQNQPTQWVCTVESFAASSSTRVLAAGLWAEQRRELTRVEFAVMGRVWLRQTGPTIRPLGHHALTSWSLEKSLSPFTQSLSRAKVQSHHGPVHSFSKYKGAQRPGCWTVAPTLPDKPCPALACSTYSHLNKH